MIFTRLANWLIARAMRTPYFHLYHADGSLYMRRYWLVPFTHKAEGCWLAKWWKEPSVWLLQKLGIAVRVHHIYTADLDRHCHDHPWHWASVVLRGGYCELRPLFTDAHFDARGEEPTSKTWRAAGSIAFRRASDRHRIARVAPGTWTLFITGPKVQWWGFYTPAGKVHYKDYDSVHNKEAIP